jgi:hypothetical protein
MPVRDGRAATSPTLCAAIEARHLGRGARFIDEDQALRIEVRLEIEPRFAPRGNVGPRLLAGVCRFF